MSHSSSNLNKVDTAFFISDDFSIDAYAISLCIVSISCFEAIRFFWLSVKVSSGNKLRRANFLIFSESSLSSKKFLIF